MNIRAYHILFMLWICFLGSTNIQAQKPFFKQYTSRNGLVGNNIISLHTDSKGNVWIGSKSGLGKYSKGEFKKFRRVDGRRIENVTHITEDKQQNIWFSTSKGEIYQVVKDGISAFNLPQNLQSELGNRLVNQLLISAENAVYVSTVIGGGLYRFSDNKVVSVLEDLEEPYTTFMVEINSGKFICGSNQQFPPNNRMYVAPLKSAPYEILLSDSSGMSRSSFISINKQVYGFAKNHEIVIFDSSGVISRKFMEQPISSVFLDNQGKIWVSLLNNGVTCYLSQEFNENNASKYLASKNITSITQDKNGTLWFGTSKDGVYVLGTSAPEDFEYSAPVVYSPAKSVSTTGIDDTSEPVKLSSDRPAPLIILNESYPEIHITGVAINSIDTSIQDLYNLAHFENTLKISYAGLVENKPGNMQYKYRLKGYDDEWNFTTNTFTDWVLIPPGEYVFEVVAMTDEGVWSISPAKVNVIVNAPFWTAWWFYALIFAIVFSAVILTYFYVGRQRSRRLAFEAEMNKRVLTSELQALRAQMNPHFMFNTLNSIQYFINHNNSEKAAQYLSKFSKLVRSILENSKKKEILIADEMEALSLYLELEAVRLNHSFETEITIDPNIDPKYDTIPAMLIQPYVENAIWHGLSHKKDKGHLKVNLALNGTHMICVVEDDGIGRDAAVIINKKKQKHDSKAMNITQERLKIINTAYNSNLSVKVEDLKNDDNVALGTKVSIFIPYNSNE